MSAFLVVLVTFVIIWFWFRRARVSQRHESKPRNPGKVRKQTFTERLRAILDAETAVMGKDWRLDLATERQIARLAEIIDGHFEIPRDLTKGQASDAIGLFEEPSDLELEQLRFFKIQGAAKFNQTEARRVLYEVLTQPDNAKLWMNRPATAVQKDQIRFFGASVAKDLKHADAAILIDELCGRNLVAAARWEELRYSYEDLVDSENRECFDIKKFSWKQFFAVIKNFEAEGMVLSEIIQDEEKVYEGLLRSYPSLGK